MKSGLDAKPLFLQVDMLRYSSVESEGFHLYLCNKIGGTGFL